MPDKPMQFNLERQVVLFHEVKNERKVNPSVLFPQLYRIISMLAVAVSMFSTPPLPA